MAIARPAKALVGFAYRGPTGGACHVARGVPGAR